MNRSGERVTQADLVAYMIATVGSLALWLATSWATGRREPWDAEVYWTVSYPLAVLLAALLGFAFPHRPWRWAVIVVFSQLLVMIVGGSGVGLLPLGMVLLAVLSVPAIAAAAIAARLRRRISS